MSDVWHFILMSVGSWKWPRVSCKNQCCLWFLAVFSALEGEGKRTASYWSVTLIPCLQSCFKAKELVVFIHIFSRHGQKCQSECTWAGNTFMWILSSGSFFRCKWEPWKTLRDRCWTLVTSWEKEGRMSVPKVGFESKDLTVSLANSRFRCTKDHQH